MNPRPIHSGARVVLLSGALLLAALWHSSAETPDIRIQEPPGMKALVTQADGVVHIRFVAAGEGPVSSSRSPTGSFEARNVGAETPSSPPASTAAATPESDAAAVVTATRAGLEKEIGGLNLDRPIAAVPAFTALDLSPESVANPSTPRDFAAALLNGVDRKGILQTGLAVETAPFRMIPGWKQDFPSYNDAGWKGFWTRLLYNFSLSVATAKASTDDEKAVNVAIGAQAVLWQDAESDPRRNEAAEAAFLSIFSPRTSAPGTAVPDQDEDAHAKWLAAVQAFHEERWAGTVWTASIAPTWHSETGKAGDLSASGFTAWSTFAYAPKNPIFKTDVRAQFLAHLRYREDEHVSDPDDANRTAKQDTLLAAARVRLGSKNFNAFAEGAYLRISNGLDGDESAYRGAIGFERRVSENMWLVVSGGEQFGEGSSENEFFALGSFRVGSAENASFPIK